MQQHHCLAGSTSDPSGYQPAPNPSHGLGQPQGAYIGQPMPNTHCGEVSSAAILFFRLLLKNTERCSHTAACIIFPGRKPSTTTHNRKNYNTQFTSSPKTTPPYLLHSSLACLDS